MALTRAQATALFNQAEMVLYDDSRMNALRKWSSVDLGRRIERARKARDRARDLLQRQKLAARARTGSKRGGSDEANQRSKQKAELLGDVLKRFEAQAKVAKQRDKAAAALVAGKGRAVSKSAARTAATATRSAGKTAARTAAATPARKTPASRKPVARQQAARKPVARRATAKPATTAPRKISARQALANTRKLLAAKQEHDRSPLPWQEIGAPRDVAHPGYQSEQAAAAAQDLHAGESRMTAIHGSISSQDRKQQGKRDGR